MIEAILLRMPTEEKGEEGGNGKGMQRGRKKKKE